jgi:putative flippase GtrA
MSSPLRHAIARPRDAKDVMKTHIVDFDRVIGRLRTGWVQGHMRRYLIWAPVSFGSNLGLTVGFIEVLLFRETTAFAIALVMVFFFNFLGARYYIFRDSKTSWRSQLRGFFLSNVFFRCVEYLAFYLLVEMVELKYLYAFFVVLGTSFVLKYLVHRLWIFPTPT